MEITIVKMYSKQVLDHFEHPRFAGDLENPTVRVEVENPACGDRLRLTLRIEGDQIVEARFKAKGCVPAMACASRIAEMVTGMSVEGAKGLKREDLVASLGGLPEASTHAGHLAVEALGEALKQARLAQSGTAERLT